VSVENKEYIRVDADVICAVCSKPYHEHRWINGFTEMGERVTFLLLCGGKLGKT
jgi:hypothetical protein